MPGALAAGDRWILSTLVALQAAWLLAARYISGVGWGWSVVRFPDGSARIGWMTNLPDSLSYASWMEQARNGATLSQILYTTSPHDAAYFNPVLWGAGTLSRGWGGAPTGWLNFAGFLAALACTVLVYRISCSLQLGRAAAFWSAATAAFGSGWSWIPILLAKLNAGEAFRGADLRFMDLLPASAMLVYPLHAIGFALVAWLWWLTLQAELSRLHSDGPRSNSSCWLLAPVAMLLSLSRPYEPAAFVAIYACYTLSSVLARSPKPLLATRIKICLALIAGIAPGLAYSSWLSSKPVWREFSHLSLHLPQSREFWLWGFGGLWITACLGCWYLKRGGNSPRYFPAVWCLFLGTWLLVLNSPLSKLAAGGGLALAISAGVAIASVPSGFARSGSRLHFLGQGACFMLLAGPLSLVLVLRDSKTFPPRVATDVFELAQALRPSPGTPTPTVLCETNAGAVLAGLGGLRVVGGHWSLTDHYAERREWLQGAGLEPSASGLTLAQQMENLEVLAAREHCDYLLISDDRPVAALIAASRTFELHGQRGAWRLYRFNQTPLIPVIAPGR